MGSLAVAVRPTDEDGVRVVRCDGEVDLSTCDQFRQALADLIADTPNSVVVDLTQTAFLDSSGVRCLVAAQAACRDQHIGFRCDVAADSPIARLFALLGLTTQLHVAVVKRQPHSGSFIDPVMDAPDKRSPMRQRPESSTALTTEANT